ncbi:hypothetical protein [Mycobacterium sp. NAZ190054]|uniref:hypothetical protein n=1 Tax=Mycobacterium sp. NAZ190054 TaxID=1747766 RepID=UPI00079ACBD0|nr:hypothetical protein [Mycobacterium sp. NAZ190054]KWX66819.1 hypothetical protein ASJ79_05495 [Mycobacterium sp. NAZ190054]
MAIYLEVMCNYDCGRMLTVEGDRPQGANGYTPKDVVYRWLGERVLDTLREHHKVCPRYTQEHKPDRHLRVVKP